MLVSELQPGEVFQYFNIISSVPRGSGNTARIARYCMEFAEEQGLEAIKDEYNNVVIYAPATVGYEDREPVILQGHLDMVCEKEPGLVLDMEHEAITVRTDGKKVWAKGTTLGGDDGIAVAYILALLASDDIPHPPIEAVFTSDEETGMFGARGLDFSKLNSRRLINIDSEEEGFICVSCAGGVRACCRIPFEQQKPSPTEYCAYEVSVCGLQGGHSGMEIDKNRENAFLVLGSLLTDIEKKSSLCLADISGGGKDNVIPKSASAVFCVPKDEANIAEQEFDRYKRLICDELSIVEPGLTIKLEKTTLPEAVMDRIGSRRVIYVLSHIPNGVERMNTEVAGLVQCSLNLGIVNVHADHVTFRTLIRSNTTDGKEILLDKVRDFIEFAGGDVVTESDYPAWEYRRNSALRELMIDEFEKQYGRKPEVTAIHAGLECGIFAGKVPDMDMVSIGPDMTGVHTPEEMLDVASVGRTWEYIKGVLSRM